MNDEDNEGWWSEDYWKGTEFEYHRSFLLFFGNWFVEFIVVVLFLMESMFYVFSFLRTRL